MNKIKICVDNGHGLETKGKRSPDGKLLEWSYTREIAAKVVDKLRDLGYDAVLITPEKIDVPLKERVRRVNAWCSELGAKNCISVSIHCNAAGADGKWHTARGWLVYIASKASANSKKLAQLLYALAEKNRLKGNRFVPAEKYWTGDLTMCRDTKCPAVLTENMFQDNEDDVKLLLSEDGKQRIIDTHVDGIIDYVNSLK